MRLKLLFVSIGLLFIFLSCDKSEGNGENLLEIVSNKTIIQADGVDEVEFSLYLNGEELVYGYQIVCDNIPIEGKRFTTEKEGKYTFVAIYGGIVSNNVTVQSVDARIPAKPSNFSTASKSLLTVMPYMAYRFNQYSWADSLVNKMEKNELTKDKFIKVTNPVRNSWKWVFPEEFYNHKIGVNQYPYIAFNHEQFSSSSIDDVATMLILKTNNLEKDAANIGVNAILDGETIITRILLKAVVEGNYYVGAFLVEDDVEFLVDGGKLQYDAIIRHIDCGDYVYGNELGYISKDATQEYIFVWNLDNIREIYNASENNWSEFVNENLRVVVYVYSEGKNSNGYSRFQFNNVTEKSINIIGA